MTAFVRTALIALLVFSGSRLAEQVSADDRGDVETTLPLSAKVKSLAIARSIAESAEPALMRASPTPPATLPDERLPQYQTRYRRREQLAEVGRQDGTMRFVLAAPEAMELLGRPLLIQAKILIDDQPFGQTRDQKMQALVASLSSDESSNPIASASADVDVDVDADADTNGEVNLGVGYQLATEADVLLQRYVRATGESPTRAEANWLMTHWTAGPNLLLLQPYFQSFRFDQRPVFLLLDRDNDGTVSERELGDSVRSFQRCDTNRDDIVDVLEIAKAARSFGVGSPSHSASSPLLMMLSDLKLITQADPLAYSAVEAFDEDQDGTVDDAEIAELSDRTPDMDLTVRFIIDEAAESAITLNALSDSLQPLAKAATTIDGIHVQWATTRIELTAIQAGASDQVSLGAVVDGYPWLPSLDPNDDGRFTIRELRQLEKRLRTFDSDGDGRLTSREARPPVRICFGLGATVHRELANVRGGDAVERSVPVVGPEWFNRMDRNADNDLTRSEFPGTDEQFETLDADGDDLVNAVEAVEFDKRSTPASPDQSDPK